MTAEAAMVLPVLVLVTAMLSWLVCFGVAQVRVIDAARETARALARGDPSGESVDVGRRIAPGGAGFAVRSDGDLVVVTVTAKVRGPGGIFGLLPGFTARAETVAVAEPSS